MKRADEQDTEREAEDTQIKADIIDPKKQNGIFKKKIGNYN